MSPKNGTWEEYQKLVLAELRRFDTDIQDIKQNQADILSELAVLKMKSGLWGALTGLATSIGATLLYFLGSDVFKK